MYPCTSSGWSCRLHVIRFCGRRSHGCFAASRRRQARLPPAGVCCIRVFGGAVKELARRDLDTVHAQGWDDRAMLRASVEIIGKSWSGDLEDGLTTSLSLVHCILVGGGRRQSPCSAHRLNVLQGTASLKRAL